MVGQGFGNYDCDDPAMFNLVDPVERNTVVVPTGGWVAIRFLVDIPDNQRYILSIPESECLAHTHMYDMQVYAGV